MPILRNRVIEVGERIGDKQSPQMVVKEGLDWLEVDQPIDDKPSDVRFGDGFINCLDSFVYYFRERLSTYPIINDPTENIFPSAPSSNTS